MDADRLRRDALDGDDGALVELWRLRARDGREAPRTVCDPIGLDVPRCPDAPEVWSWWCANPPGDLLWLLGTCQRDPFRERIVFASWDEDEVPPSGPVAAEEDRCFELPERWVDCGCSDVCALSPPGRPVPVDARNRCRVRTHGR